MPDATPRVILCTDLDGTFLGGTDAERKHLYQLIEAHRSQVHLVFVTGRDLDHIQLLCEQPGFPRPDHIVGDVGTTVVDGRTLEPVEPIQSEIAAAWGSPNERIDAVVAGSPGIRPQPTAFSYRRSFYYEPDTLDPSLPGRIEALGYDCLLSANLYLDVLPKGISKGPTLTRLLDQLGFDRHRALVAGDTRNDTSMFLVGLKGVVVGNAEPQLKDATQGIPQVIHATGHGAAGIVEALHHFNLHPIEGASP